MLKDFSFTGDRKSKAKAADQGGNGLQYYLSAEPDSGAGMFFSGHGMKAAPRKKAIKSKHSEDGDGLFFSGTPISSQNGSGGSKKIVRLNNLSTKDAIRQHGKGLSVYLKNDESEGAEFANEHFRKRR
jgi:hypothetical protein